MNNKILPQLLRVGVLIGLVGGGVNASADHLSIGIGLDTASPIGTETAVTLPQGRWSVSERTSYIDNACFSDSQFAAIATANPDADVHCSGGLLNTSLGAFYGLTDNWTVGARLPYLYRFDLKAHEPGADPTDVENLGSPNGLGDMLLITQYRFLNLADKHQAALLLGVKTPTGVTSRASPTGELLEATEQPGTGSWDGIFGLAYTYWYPNLPFAIDTNLLYTLSTEGTQQTIQGDVFNYNLAFSYHLGGGAPGAFYARPQKTASWDLVMELNGEWRDTPTVSGVEDPNHGGNVVYFSPGVRFSSGSNWSLSLLGGVPVATDLNGIQAEPNYRILGGLSVGF